ncbi:MAG: glycosyltransferase family 2 protein [Acidobacteriia bacterium]|nr:glycosyltransferase family 2 protein [Terriglobia bacterium]
MSHSGSQILNSDRKLAIVIPVHNRLGFTRSCLEHLRRQTVSGFQIIVVDDGSSDGTSEMIRDEFPDVTLLHGDGNLWWTGATNLGVKVAVEQGASHVMTLNDDTVPEPAFVENMWMGALEKPEALVGAYSVEVGSGRPVFGGERIHWTTGFIESLLQDPANSREGLVEVTHYAGRGLLIPKAVFQRIGLFDAVHFPHYAADYDFTYRAGRYGYPVFCNYQARLGIYPEASGDAANRRRKGLRNYYRHLFDIKGGANLKVFFWFALRNCPKYLLPIGLPMGMARRIFGYPMEWMRETCRLWWNRDASYRRA